MLNETLKFALIPLNITIGDKADNLSALERYISAIDKSTDIVVVPELFTTGFVGDKDRMVDLSETLLGETVERVQRLSTYYNMAICGSFLVRVGGQLLNRAFFIEPNGEETFYDKAHLFSVSQEAQILHRGTHRPPIVRYRGWSISMIVCYDLRFPLWCRNVGLSYDVMIVPANWPEARRGAWDSLLAARAIENQAYYLACDRSGEDEFGLYPDSMTYAVDYLGRRMPDGAGIQHTWPPVPKVEGVITGMLEKAPLRRYREKFPAWRDADSFHI